MTYENAHSLLGKTLVLHDTIPINWTPAHSLLSPHHLLRLNERNEKILRLLTAYSEKIPNLEPFDKQVINHEIMLLDIKLDVILSMVGEIMLNQRDLPESSQLWLNATGIEWTGKNLPAIEENVIINIFISYQCPRPLELPAKIIGHAKRNEKKTVIAKFEGISDHCTNYIEKLVFQYHRRLIAQKKTLAQQALA